MLLFVRKGDRSFDWPDARPFATHFARRARVHMVQAQGYFGRLADGGEGLAAWGAGSRGLCLIARAGIADCFDFLVDDSRERLGLSVPGGQLEVLPSSELLVRGSKHCVVLPLRSKAVEAWSFASKPSRT